MSVLSDAMQRSGKYEEEVISLPGNRQLVTKGFIDFDDKHVPLVLREKTSADILRSSYQAILPVVNAETANAATFRCRLSNQLLGADRRTVGVAQLAACEHLGAQIGCLGAERSGDKLLIWFVFKSFCGVGRPLEPAQILTVDLNRRPSRLLRLHR